ncbi:hypothetical protein [Calidithermus roseus]|uniref:Uncharacterized protein n=1 Tax=Calidithermus roseus TaxID=1644118 RepID=A0A399EPG6_9DEIN|nr:hypothetical protein [Calidithermus roseus]RIH84031.1 hypothetical protein Mrose_02797 [Calidithermus roseus]
MRGFRHEVGSLLRLALIVRLGLPERLRWIWLPGLNPPAMFRHSDQARLPLSLEHAYYPVQSRGGIVLIPKDAYYQEAEELLEWVSRDGV